MRNVMTKAWEIAREGQRKFGGSVKEYFAEALRMAWAIVKKGVSKMIEFAGTEKQVAWAKDIYPNAIEKINNVIVEMEEWANKKRGRARAYAQYIEIFEEMKKNNSAKFWIEKFGYNKLHTDFIPAFNRYVNEITGNDIITQQLHFGYTIAMQLDTK